MGVGGGVKPVRGHVYLVALDPSVGKELKKTRPCVVVSPDELNQTLSTVLVAPLTTGGHPYPMRIPCTFRKRRGSSSSGIQGGQRTLYEGLKDFSRGSYQFSLVAQASMPRSAKSVLRPT